MPNREKLETLLRTITDEEFETVWKATYGYLPTGKRSDLAKDFVAEQYDTELDDCIKGIETLLHVSQPAPHPKPNKWLAPR